MRFAIAALPPEIVPGQARGSRLGDSKQGPSNAAWPDFRPQPEGPGPLLRMAAFSGAYLEWLNLTPSALPCAKAASGAATANLITGSRPSTMKLFRLVLPAVMLLLAGCSGQEILNASERSSGNDVTTDIVFDATNKLKPNVYTSHATPHPPTIG